MLADRVRMRFLDTEPRPEDIADENCRVATDEDFSGTTDGSFKYIGTATSLVIPHEIKGVPVTSYVSMFSETTVTEVRSNNPRITNIAGMFMMSSLTSLDLSNFDTSNVTNMSWMFLGCNNLTSLDVSNFDTASVTNMGQMFYSCHSLNPLDLSSFDTSNVTNMHQMFTYCNSVTTAYARTQEDADKFNASSGKESNVNFVVKG